MEILHIKVSETVKQNERNDRNNCSAAFEPVLYKLIFNEFIENLFRIFGTKRVNEIVPKKIIN